MEKLNGKVAVITGGVTEINAAIANKINAEGGKAIILAAEAVEAVEVAVPDSIVVE